MGLVKNKSYRLLVSLELAVNVFWLLPYNNRCGVKAGMKRNLVLVLALVIMIPLVVNGVSRISSFRGTSQKVDEARTVLEQLKKENENLKKELQYKSSDRFAEEEIRNKLGMAKPGETEVIIPKANEQNSSQSGQEAQAPNWQKWRDLFLGKS